MLMRLLFLVQLILGLIFWIGGTNGLVGLHMLVGILFVITVWYLGVVQGLQSNGSLGLTVGTFVGGLLLAIVGMIQGRVLVGGAHWIIQVIHLLLAITAIGLGEMSVARYNRARAASPAVQ
jgi:hypothetical protein